MSRPKGSKDKAPRKRHSTGAYVEAYNQANPEEAKTRSEKIKEKIKEWKARGGRPPNYKEEFCEMLVEHMAKGAPFDTFAAEVFCAAETLYEWCKKYPEFANAKKLGEKLSHEWWDRQGRKGLNIGPKSFHGQVWSITMKNRFGYRDKQEVQLTGAGGGPIEIKKTVQWDSESEARLKALEEKAKRVQEMTEEDVLKAL